MIANKERGEVMLGAWKLRPSYAALVAAEAEIGPLFALLERTSDGRVALSEMIALLWHCADPKPDGLARADFAEQCISMGVAKVTPAYRALIEAALAGV